MSATVQKVGKSLAIHKWAASQHVRHIAKARARCKYFSALVLINEKTGKSVKNAPFHNDWHDFMQDTERGVLFSAVEHGKTSCVVGQILFRLGKNSNTRIAIVSNTASQAQKILSSVRQYIEAAADLNNPNGQWLREVFPNLKPGATWHSEAITVSRETISKDPSVQAIGIGGPINGSRVDCMFLDDVCDFENTRTVEAMQKLADWWDTTASTRITADGQVIVVGTPWDNLDLMHNLSDREGFVSLRFAAVENPDDPPNDWRSRWPQQWPLERLLKVHKGTTPAAWARKYLVRIADKESSKFKQEWIDLMVRNGANFNYYTQNPQSQGRAWPTFTGVDLGVGQDENHDMTAFFTIAIEPGGMRRRVVCDIEYGRWTGPDIVTKIAEKQRRYNSIMVVEGNGAQRYLSQFSAAQGVAVRTYYTTAQGKYGEDFGIESIGVEMANGLWVLPSKSGLSDGARKWIEELLYYTPKAHTGDVLMASFFAREAARNYGFVISGGMDVQAR